MSNQINDLSFTLNPEAAASYYDDGIVILHTGNGCLFTSNGIGARIWRGVERRLSWKAIVEEITGEYKIALAAAREDTFRFLAELERRELILREVAL